MEQSDRWLTIASALLLVSFLAYTWLDGIENKHYEERINKLVQTVVSQQETIVDLHSEIRELKTYRE